MSKVQILNPPLSTHTIHQFPHPTWIENLAIRANGSILCTLITTPEVYLIEPSTSLSPAKATLIHTFPSILATTGIIEVGPGSDLFAVCTGDFNVSTFQNTPGSYSVWLIDLSKFDPNEPGSKASVTKITDLPASGLLNGMELLASSHPDVLIADSEVGCVWRLNTATGSYEQTIQIPAMEKPAQGLPMGVNGIKLRGGYLYWTNTGKALFCRIPVDEQAKVTAGAEAEVLVEDINGDDFVFDEQGNAWVAQPEGNTVAVIKGAASGKGEVVTVAGEKNDLAVSGGTACHFGKREDDRHILYVSTTGALVSPVNGSVTEGGKIAGIDTRAFYA